MLRATQSTDIPAGDLGRVKPEDTERTRMLKTVMRSVAKYSAGGLGKTSNESAQAAGALIMKSQAEEDEEIRRLIMEREQNPCEWGFFSNEQERHIRDTVAVDEDLRQAEADPEFVELLRYSGDLVTSLSGSLSSSQPIPKKPHIDTAPLDVYMVSRKEAEDIVAGGATDHARREQAAWAWVQDNVKFKELEKLSRDRINGAEKYEDLRSNFDQHYEYHPVLFELTDHTLIDETAWERAVQEAKFPSELATFVPPEKTTPYTTPKALNRSRVGSKSSVTFESMASRSNKVSWAAQPGAGTVARGARKGRN